MTANQALSALKQYSSVEVHTGVDSASPHRLIQLLMEGVLDRLAAAAGYMQRGEVAKKGEQLGSAISIIDGLRANLDFDAGASLAGRLDSLYDYMGRRLLEANLSNDPAIIREVESLMRPIKRAWDAIPAGSAEPSGTQAGGPQVASGPGA